MKNRTATKIVGAVLVVGLMLIGVWALRQERGSGAANAVPTAGDVLAALPASTGGSPTDREVVRWSQKARQNEQDDSAWANLGDALMQKARETADAGYYGHAERIYRKALEINAKSVSAITGLAWVHSGRHEFEKSIEWANKAIALDPKNHAAYGLLGDAAMEMGEYKKAFEHYQKMLDIRPDISSYSRGAHLLYLTGNTRKGLWLMGKAVGAGAPYAENTAWCRAQYAQMLLGFGAVLPAEQILNAALKQMPNDYHLHVAMGKVKTARNDYAAAIEQYQKAIAIAPQYEAVVALGDLYALTGKKEDAEKQYALVEAIHKLNKSNGVLSDAQMARFYADHDRNLPEALKIARAEYKTRPNIFVADTLAWALYKNGRYAEAADTIKKALRLKTPDASILYHAGMIYAKRGDRITAQKYLYKALSINPNFHPLHARIAADTLKTLGSSAPSLQRRASAGP